MWPEAETLTLRPSQVSYLLPHLVAGPLHPGLASGLGCEVTSL